MSSTSSQLRGPLEGGLPEEGDVVRYFSSARHALVALLRALNVGVNARVLLPEYICRDLLASLHAVGALPVYYAVDSRLNPSSPPAQWPRADVVLMVDYFGFAQDSHPFERYREMTGALLIEDNAHGYLSRDGAGQWLGQRGDAGLFSLRKTLLLPDGAAYRLNRDVGRWRPAPQLEAMPASAPLGMRVRGMLGRLPGGRHIAVRMAALWRLMRKLRFGHAIPRSADAERVIPGRANPHLGLQAVLASCRIEDEIVRRRHLYEELEKRMPSCGARLVFPDLPVDTAPYGMPVYSDDAAALGRVAKEFGLDSFRWPDLPDALAATAPAHYRNLHVVNFL